MQEEIYNKYAERISDEEQWADAKEVKAQLLSVDLKLPFELRAVESALHEFTRHLAEELQVRRTQTHTPLLLSLSRLASSHWTLFGARK